MRDPTSPGTVSWDNPFPTFPTNKKKIKHTEDESLNRSVDEVSLGGDSRAGQRAVFGLPAAGQQNKHSNTRNRDHAYPRNTVPAESHVPDVPDTWNAQGSFQNRLDQSAHPREEFRPQTDYGRLPEDTNGNTSFSQPAAYQLDAPRSRTMPNNISESMLDPDLRKVYNQRPTTRAGGPESIHQTSRGNIQDSHYSQPSRPPMPLHSYSGEVQSSSEFASHEQRMVQPSPQHSQQESFSDVFDSYYHSPHHSDYYPAHREERHYPAPPEPTMPNFDEVPGTRAGHHRGMTFDDHLRAQQRVPPIPSMPPQAQLGMPGGVQPASKSGQGFSRSRSSPNLQDEGTRRPQQFSDGFNFELPGSVPAMYSPAPKSNHDHYSINDTEGSPRQHGHSERRQDAVEYRTQNSARPHQPTDRPSTSGSHGMQRLIPSPEVTSQPPTARSSPFHEGQSIGTRNGPSPVAQVGPTSPPTGQIQPPVSSNGPSFDGHGRRTRNEPSPVAHVGPAFPPAGQIQPPAFRNGTSFENQGNGSRNGPSRKRHNEPFSPPVGRSTNPDASPSHPAPVRAGLVRDAPANPPSRPPPVRQYSGPSPSRPESSFTQKPQISRAPREQNRSPGVTHGELERLKQSVRTEPSNNQNQLVLARKLVEAASVLADEGGRVDAKTKSRNRERYISDAYKLVKRLVHNGYPDAMFYLGDCYSRGSLGLEKDAKEAFGQYQSAAKLGHAQAAYRVAVCCEMGLDEGGGTKRDAVKAMQWYNRAATLGDAPAMYKMGVIQLKGLLGQPKSTKAALSWLERAAQRADKENPHALHELVRDNH